VYSEKLSADHPEAGRLGFCLSSGSIFRLRHYFRLIIFPVIVSAAACSSSPRTPSSAGLRTVLQEYFDDQPAARETLEFYDEAMMCRVVNGNNSCPEQSKPKLEMLIKAGLLSAAAPAPGVTTYRITAEGKRYIHPLGIVATRSQAESNVKPSAMRSMRLAPSSLRLTTSPFRDPTARER
jgi:hypothetical protein